MSIKAENLRIALIKTYADALADFMKTARAELLDDLLEKFEEEGTKSFTVTLPNGEKVGQVTLPESKPSDDVVDPASLFEWAEPQGGIKVDVIPAQAERVEKRIDYAWLDGKIKNSIPGDGGDLIDSETGEVIPGVKRTPGGIKPSFTITFAKDGREKLATAYRRGELNELVNGTVLPAIETAAHRKEAA